MVDSLAGSSDALTLTLPEDVILQTEGLEVDLLEDRKRQTIVLLALIVIPEDGVVLVFLLVLDDVLNVARFVVLKVFHLFHQRRCLALDCTLFLELDLVG